jgi:hypothetical protein
LTFYSAAVGDGGIGVEEQMNRGGGIDNRGGGEGAGVTFAQRWEAEQQGWRNR